MAYKFDKNGLIVGDGLPDGVTVDVNQYQSALKQFESSRKSGNALYPSADSKSQLSDSITNFVYRNGKVQGFLPELQPYQAQGIGDVNKVGTLVPAYQEIGMGVKGAPKGYFVDVGGIVFDEATKSGNIPDGADVSFSSDQGSTLATFKNGNEVAGYMRLATQQAKQADNLRLGNQSGTLSGSVRQNAQRRTIL